MDLEGANKRKAGDVEASCSSGPSARPRLAVSQPQPSKEESSQILDLPDALLLRVMRLACATEEGTDEPLCCDHIEARLRSVVAGSADLELSEPWVDLELLCRLRGVCRRFAELVEAGAAAPRARLEIDLDLDLDLDVHGTGEPEPDDSVEIDIWLHQLLKPQAVLRRACAGAALVAGIEELDLRLSASLLGKVQSHGIGVVSLHAVSLEPLACFRSLRALRLCSDHRYAFDADLLAAAPFPRLSSLDLAGRATLRPLTHAALAALSSRGHPLAALRANVACSALSESRSRADAGEPEPDVVALYPPSLPGFLSGVVRAFPGLQRLLLTFEGRFESPLSPDALNPLASLPYLRALSLKLSTQTGSAFLAPLARLEFRGLEHLAVSLHRSRDCPDLSPIAALKALRSLSLYCMPLSQDVSFLAALPRLEALELLAFVSRGPSPLAPLAPRLRCLRLSSNHRGASEAAAANIGALSGALASFSALEDLRLELFSDAFDGLSGRSLAAWRGLRSLHLAVKGSAAGLQDGRESDRVRPLPGPLLSSIASDLVGLRDLVLENPLALPLPDGVADALRGRLRRLRLSAGRPARAELEGALGIKVKRYSS
eukprot:tig00000367_g24460.t1